MMVQKMLRISLSAGLITNKFQVQLMELLVGKKSLDFMMQNLQQQTKGIIVAQR